MVLAGRLVRVSAHGAWGTCWLTWSGFQKQRPGAHVCVSWCPADRSLGLDAGSVAGRAHKHGYTLLILLPGAGVGSRLCGWEHAVATLQAGHSTWIELLPYP